MAYAWRSLYEGGTYTWSKTSVKEKEGLSGGGGYRQRNTVHSPAPLKYI